MCELCAVLGPCSSCLSVASAPSSTRGTSSGLRQPLDGDLSASVAQSSSESAGRQLFRTGTTVAQPTDVHHGKASVDANVTRPASTVSPRSNAGTLQTTFETLQAETSNNYGEASALEASKSGSLDAPSAQTDEILDRTSSSQRAQSTGELVPIPRNPVTGGRVSRRGLNPSSVSASLNHNNVVTPRYQQSLATTSSRASFARRTEIQSSAQQQTRLGTSSAYPTHANVPNVSVASIASPFDIPSSDRDFYPRYLAPQHPVDSDAPEYLGYPYAQYFHTQ